MCLQIFGLLIVHGLLKLRHIFVQVIPQHCPICIGKLKFRHLQSNSISLFAFTSLLTYDTLDSQTKRETHDITFVDWLISRATDSKIDACYLSLGQIAFSGLLRCILNTCWEAPAMLLNYSCLIETY